MLRRSAENRRRLEMLDRASLADLQLAKLNDLLAAILPHNRFYAEKLSKLKLPLHSLEQLSELPFTSKDELAVGSGPAANLTWPLDNYCRYHETSGTRGRPLPVYDTSDDWQWWIDCWQFVLDAARIQRSRSRDVGLLLRSVHRVLERSGCARRTWIAGDTGGRNEFADSARFDPTHRLNGPVLHPHLRDAPGGRGRGASREPGRQ